MVQKISVIATLALSPEGFQGFNPASDAEKNKIGLAFPDLIGSSALDNMQKAKFVKTTIVSATDDDAGNGQSVDYDRPSVETDTIYCYGNDVSEIATGVLDATGFEGQDDSYERLADVSGSITLCQLLGGQD